MQSPSKNRVVVAVRLHAALMALAAGHYVIHLAYERKGFGAYDDLGLSPWIHNINSFDPSSVARQVEALTKDPAVRADYEARITAAAPRIVQSRQQIICNIREAQGAL